MQQNQFGENVPFGGCKNLGNEVSEFISGKLLPPELNKLARKNTERTIKVDPMLAEIKSRSNARNARKARELKRR